MRAAGEWKPPIDLMVHNLHNQGLLDLKNVLATISSVKMNFKSTATEPATDSRRKMLCLVRAKACKRCGGDLSIECDVYGVYIECIQCGATWTKNDLKYTPFQEKEPKLKAEDVKPLTPTRQR
jgi:hypothetical protein